MTKRITIKSGQRSPGIFFVVTGSSSEKFTRDFQQHICNSLDSKFAVSFPPSPGRLCVYQKKNVIKNKQTNNRINLASNLENGSHVFSQPRVCTLYCTLLTKAINCSRFRPPRFVCLAPSVRINIFLTYVGQQRARQR